MAYKIEVGLSLDCEPDPRPVNLREHGQGLVLCLVLGMALKKCHGSPPTPPDRRKRCDDKSWWFLVWLTRSRIHVASRTHLIEKGSMSKRVRVRWLTDEEGQQLWQIVHRGHGRSRWPANPLLVAGHDRRLSTLPSSSIKWIGFSSLKRSAGVTRLGISVQCPGRDTSPSSPSCARRPEQNAALRK